MNFRIAQDLLHAIPLWMENVLSLTTEIYVFISCMQMFMKM